MNFLILLNPQIDFCEGGAVEIQGAKAFLKQIYADCSKYNKLIAIVERHPADHISFAGNHLWRKPAQVLESEGKSIELMISHCVDGQFGSFIILPFQESDFDRIIALGKIQDLETGQEFIENEGSNFLEYFSNLKITAIDIKGLVHNNIDEVLKEYLVNNGLEIGDTHILKYQHL